QHALQPGPGRLLDRPGDLVRGPAVHDLHGVRGRSVSDQPAAARGARAHRAHALLLHDRLPGRHHARQALGRRNLARLRHAGPLDVGLHRPAPPHLAPGIEALLGGGSMRRYFTLLRIFVANSLQLELEYRANLLIDFISSLLGFASGLVVIYAMFSNAKAIGGWSLPEAIALFGVFMIFEAFIEVFLYPNLGKLPDYVRTGNMDFMLLKPLSSQFLVSFRYFNVWRAPDAIVGSALLGYGMLNTGGLSPASLLLAAVMLLAGAVTTYAIWCLLTTTAFWWVRVNNMMELFNAFFVAGRFPI